MKVNIGTTDRIIRVIAAVLIAAAGFYYKIWWLYLIACVPFLTALFGFCCLYTLFGINTCKTKKKE